MDILRDSDPKETIVDEIASTGKCETLTNEKIMILANGITVDEMEKIGEGYMDISYETIMDLKDKNRQDAVAFKREIIKKWARKNPGAQQVEVYSSIYLLK